MHLRSKTLLLLAITPILCAFNLWGLLISVAIGEVPEGRFERLGPYGGEVRSLLINPNDSRLIYLGTTDGQLYRSEDGGSSWTLPFPGLGRRQIVIDTLIAHPTDAAHIYAGGWNLRTDGGDLFESRDGGISWDVVRLPQASPAVRDLAICRGNPNYLIVGALEGVYVSSDGGANWSRVGGQGVFQKVESVAIDPVDPRFIYVGTWRLSYRSADFGKTWTRAESGMLFDSDVFSISIDPREPGRIFASACSGVYRSTDRAASWRRLKILPDRFTVRSQVVCLDPADSRRIYVGSTEGLFLSEDQGQSWKRLTAPNLTINAIQIDPRNNKKIFVGTGNEGVLRSEDGGLSWNQTNRGFSHRNISRIFPDNEAKHRFFTGILSDGARGDYYVYDEKDGRWSSVTSGLVIDSDILAFLSLPDRLGRLIGTGRGAYRQSSQAASWVRLAGPIGKLTVSDFAYDPASKVIYAATSEGVYRSWADQISFQMSVASHLRPRVWSLVVSPSRPGVVYGTSNLGVIRSIDQGVSWQVISYGIPLRVRTQCVAACPAEKEHLLAGTVAGLYETTDEGRTWRRVADSRLGIDISSIIFLDHEGRKIMAADNTSGGVFLSGDGGRKWDKIESGEYASPVRNLAQDPTCASCVYLGTASDGVYRLRLKESSYPRNTH